MIKRILEKDEFKKVLDDIFSIHDHENDNEGHLFLKHDKDHIFRAFGETSILTWDFFVWANLNQQNKYDAVIAFLNNKNEKFGKQIFSEYIWLSKNPLVGHRLFGTALKFAKEKEFQYVTVNTVTSHPKSHKVAKFYEKMGFLKDSETYIAKIHEPESSQKTEENL